MEKTPADVSKPPETEHQKSVIFDLRRQDAKGVQFNHDRIDNLTEQLRAARGFRVLIKTKRLNRRVYNEVWSDGIHLVKGFGETGVEVQEAEGRWCPTKDVLPTDIPEASMEQGDAPLEEEAQTELEAPTSVGRAPSASRAQNFKQQAELIRM